ncbi:MAG TPA: helix-turn-helix transcriptional regulator [Longimicrobiales bacterium]|jgi:DNA-binding PadR family transcriptional regulator
MAKLGEFELLVLLALLRQSDEPYANRVREAIEERTGRSVARGALYRTLDRLEEKGLLEWEMEPSATPARGGHPMRRLLVTEEGIGAARQATLVFRSFLDGLDPILNT